MKINTSLMQMAIENTKKQNSLEDKIALEWFGCTWEELDYDDKELVTYEAIDRLER